LKQKKIELLAPAQNLELGKMAIRCGADAVYIGANKFGARAKVGNSIEDIAELMAFASQFYARVYVTVNTLLFDEEVQQAVKLIEQCYHAGVDGVIIQDMGLLEFDLPPVPIIASTQCFVNTPAKARFFQELGFRRIILPRELSLKQIQAIRLAVPAVELEFFVHGALCVGYSGQCYLSYAMGGRSGNRGVCAQPCRKIYRVTDSAGKVIVSDKHLLSLKDLNLSAHISDLLDAGISSFKIEGRLKDETYIKNIVSYYRREIDKVLQEKQLSKTSSGNSEIPFIPDPGKTFNRGYTDYFIRGKQNSIASIHTPKMQGEYLGKVKSVTEKYFILDSGQTLANGDGICFFSDGKLMGTNINTVVGDENFPAGMDGIFIGQEIYRNLDHQFIKNLKSASVSRKIGLNIEFVKESFDFKLIATDEDGNKAELPLDFQGEIAKNLQLAKKSLIENLQKTGNTIFHCTAVKIDTEEIPFLKKSEINQLRRNLLEKLIKIRAANRPLSRGEIIKITSRYVTEYLDFRGNVLNEKARQFYQRHGVKKIDDGAEKMSDMSGCVLMTTKYCLREELGHCCKKGENSVTPDWFLSDEAGNHFRLKFNCAVCEMEVIKI